MNVTAILPELSGLRTREAVVSVMVMNDPLVGLSHRGRILADELSTTELLDVAALTLRLGNAALFVNRLASEALERQSERQLSDACPCHAKTDAS